MAQKFLHCANVVAGSQQVGGDALEARRKPAEQLRIWAIEQFARLDDLATRTTVDLKDRQMVEAFVERIEINPGAKTGVVDLMADLEGALLRSSTRLPLGD